MSQKYIILIINIMLIQFAMAEEIYPCPVEDKITKNEIIHKYKNNQIDYARIFSSNNSYEPNAWFVDKKDPENITFFCEFIILKESPPTKGISICRDPSIYTIRFTLDKERRVQDVFLFKDMIEVRYIPRQVWSNADKIETYLIK